MGNIEQRIEKLENFEARSSGNQVLIKLYDGDPRPTAEEVEAAKVKFLEEHPGHQGLIVLDFLHLDGDKIKRRKEGKQGENHNEH